MLVRWPRAGQYRLTIFAKGCQETGALWEAADYLIQGTGAARAPFPLTYSTFGEHGVTLREPLTGRLSAGRPQTFSLLVPGAQEVNVVFHRQWLRLTKEGDEFTGTITPTAGEVQLVADSWVLARYEAK